MSALVSELERRYGSAWHVNSKQILESLGIASGAGTPVGSATPAHVGQEYFDTTNSDFYKATGTTSSDWAFVGGSQAGRVLSIPIMNAKVGATAGWVITAGTNIAHATLPASQTNSTLVVPISGLEVGDIVTAVAVGGQVESAGGNVTLAMDVRKLTNAAADNTDASIGTDDVGTLTADTVISASNLAVTGLTETLAANETLYVLLTGTTAASTDIDLTHLLVTVTKAQ